MAAIFEEEAPLTAHNQITIPASIRKILNLRGGKSRIMFHVLKDGEVLISRAEPRSVDNEDPALRPFLDFLAKDVAQHPKRIVRLPSHLLTRARSVIKGVKLDLDGPLIGSD
ncbi:MAG: type II toxin-antitoxin system PrlF family antitoxin [Methylacidiphilales bacterium]|nr:type II toxin-antitoxin system PrlF family antitoxin [Candidatus Methylacidiphilales bacterium]